MPACAWVVLSALSSVILGTCDLLRVIPSHGDRCGLYLSKGQLHSSSCEVLQYRGLVHALSLPQHSSLLFHLQEEGDISLLDLSTGVHVTAQGLCSVVT